MSLRIWEGEGVCHKEVGNYLTLRHKRSGNEAERLRQSLSVMVVPVTLCRRTVGRTQEQAVCVLFRSMCRADMSTTQRDTRLQ